MSKDNNPTPPKDFPRRPKRWAQFLNGAAILARVPGAVLFATSIGYGALARESGLDVMQMLTVSIAFYALPAQVVFVDLVGRGASLFVIAFAVALTAVRLLPMTVSLIPLVREHGRVSPFAFLSMHYVSVTTWIEGHQNLAKIEEGARLAFFTGIGTGILCATLVGACAGFYLAQVVPPVISAMLLFMTPAYFILSLIASVRMPADWVAIALGCVLGPAFHLVVPDIDLLLTGLVGGSIAYVVGRGSAT